MAKNICAKNTSPQCINLEGYGWNPSTPEFDINYQVTQWSNDKDLMQNYDLMI